MPPRKQKRPVSVLYSQKDTCPGGTSFFHCYLERRMQRMLDESWKSVMEDKAKDMKAQGLESAFIRQHIQRLTELSNQIHTPLWVKHKKRKSKNENLE